MNRVALRATGVGKRYRIGRRQAPYQTLRETIQRAAWAPVRGARHLLSRSPRPSRSPDVIWALKGASFEISPGEVVGIIGRNGAGKTTLMKIISRITEPTEGQVEVWGRVRSLLEVGTGFHPELTGRENVFLNGAILGMRREEIAGKFDEIVAFAEIDALIDTPVKHYSSGMYVRLAFAVAAHLDSEILLVDEVLAVGDHAFQKKCLGRMEAASQTGRTILFVSHNMPTIMRLCPRTILLDQGRIVDDGPSERIVGAYLSSGLGMPSRREWPDPESAPGNDVVRLRSVCAIEENGRVIENVDVRRPVGIALVFDVVEQRQQFVPGFAVYNDQGGHVFSSFDVDPAWREPRTAGRYVSTGWIPGNLLNEGTMVVSVALTAFASGGKGVKLAHAPDVVAFHVYDPGEGGSARGDYVGTWSAPVRPLLRWTTTMRESEANPSLIG